MLRSGPPKGTAEAAQAAAPPRQPAARSTRERLKATLRREEEALSPRVLRRTLGGYACHPNFAAVLVVGLGCETNQIQGLIAQEGLQEGARLVTFNIQDTGGTKKTVARGIELVEWMLADANRVQRQPVASRTATEQRGTREMSAVDSHGPQVIPPDLHLRELAPDFFFTVSR